MASVSNSGGGYDISNRNSSIYSKDYDAYVNRWEEEEKLKKLYEDKGTLSFEDMLTLMVSQFQNQTMDDQASTTDMMNQLVQMSTMQAMNTMVDSMGELQLASVMSYAASLVTQKATVTLFDGYDEDGMMIERVATVTGMGTYGGQTVIFVDGKDMYYLSDILAVGELPEKKTDIETPEDPENKEDVPTPPIEDNGTPDIDEDGNPIDTPTPPIKDDGEVDDPDPEYNGENGTETEGLG